MQWGVPYYALGLSAAICCLAYMNVSTASKTVFGYFVNLVSIFGLLTWCSILVSHIHFVKARRAQGVPDDSPQLRYRSPFGLWGSYFALAFCVLISLTKNFNVWRGMQIRPVKPRLASSIFKKLTDLTFQLLGGGFDYKSFITGYLGIPLYLIMIFGYKIFFKTQGHRPENADLWTGKAAIDADEQEWLAKEADDRANGRDGSWLYKHSLGYLF